mmetsp:Transcript_72372/g.117400  ORF Transcript_72372/g.117400 Transcript_72372/m.117400 type:complete len:80 (-) Transcript_72372:15-254(-)
MFCVWVCVNECVSVFVCVFDECVCVMNCVIELDWFTFAMHAIQYKCVCVCVCVCARMCMCKCACVRECHDISLISRGKS